MKSSTLPSFWTAYTVLEKPTQQAARKAYGLWAEYPLPPFVEFQVH